MNLISLSDAKAHTCNEREQSLIEHLENTATLASSFASHFGFRINAYYAGLYHDIGKCTEEFAKRLEGGPRVNHSSAGAYLMFREKRIAESIAIASHHTGLLDMGRGDKYETGTFLSMICNNPELDDFRVFLDELGRPDASDNTINEFHDISAMQWFVRVHFLFSSLVDADYSDTRRFMENDDSVHLYDFANICDIILKKADEYLQSSPSSTLNAVRNAMLEECIAHGGMKQGLYTLTIPTGGGKTFSSLAFAASHARNHKNIRRIIYVIPYTSIIEQNAEVIRKITGNENVLEHHSVSPIYFSEGEDAEAVRMRLAAENWDIPIIVTTNEQFFESLFSNIPSKCRKIHNISDSVIIFDEAQMFPRKYLALFSSLLETLVGDKNYGITAVLCTATQPSLDCFLNKHKPVEIVSSQLSADPVFNRVCFVNIGDINDFQDFIMRISEPMQSLVIVNRKADAKMIYEALPVEGRYYLSTNLTPYSRSCILLEIRQRLKKGKICHVVSTSLIEAGVDVDFPVVFREIYGLDSIIQAGGRCNREGLNKSDSSKVYIFNLCSMKNYADYSRKCNATRFVLDRYDDISSPESIREYYKMYYRDSRTDDALDLFRYRLDRLPFEEIGNKIKIIDGTSIGIFIRQNEYAEEIYQKITKGGVSRDLLRRASQFTVRCPVYVAEAMIADGSVEIIFETFCVLKLETCYNEDTGICYSHKEEAEAFFF
ncbi:MAG: CRISPR-associated helicase Cas3' [Spirochaetes bacterium]|uniref:CRISPR-associated helicase Cas3 n=1 Tax=Candidatus Ornithospirochaeta stercoripullorum TaxID=2840899 RepID=A0A9D9E0A4_9SPIO|nr:CRISPR-associated helicase Cas3' [Candidatus Ornithospirochaeta stercoripullorum]